MDVVLVPDHLVLLVDYFEPLLALLVSADYSQQERFIDS